MSNQETYRYCLSKNDEDIIKHYSKEPLSENARKTLTILSEVFGGLHHLDQNQLEIFEYQSGWEGNEYLIRGSLATFDSMNLTLLVIIAHDMAVRLEIQSTALDTDWEYEKAFLQKMVDEVNSEYNTKYDITNIFDETEFRPTYLRLLFHQRTRDGDFSHRHPTLEDSMTGFRAGNKRYA